MKKACKSSGIGGQAVLEGIMMKNQEVYSIGVRRPDGEIEVHLSTHEGIGNKKLKKIPLIRGVINFVDSLVLGMKCLTFSASFYDEEEAKPSKADMALQKIFKDRAEKIVMGVTVAFSIVMAVAIFMVLPYYLADIFRRYIVSDTVLAVVEGGIRLLLFISYVLLISLMRDIQRVFQYHGAEHKCINCIENGLELKVENVRRSSKHHKRCGTSFMLIVMVISIIFFIFIRVESPILRVVYRVALVPVIAGVSYEFIRLAGNTDNLIIRILSLPGMWLQSLTTKEPDDDMIEVAIAAVEAVFDWRVYQGRAEEEPIEALAESLEEEAAPAAEQPETEAEEQPEAVPDRTAEETVEEIELEEIMSVEAAGLEGPEYEEEQEEASEGFQDIEDILEAEQ
ncbi:MAG: DUF1385 domain-containing protein [Lachnospiraceae bacterium]|nr:DUF1385 domain-containing protein [Lachnospiraceae bacterium]MCI9623002.1 DUF1385 domain-containing protein [Lachnospiraceae bacterium]